MKTSRRRRVEKRRNRRDLGYFSKKYHQSSRREVIMLVGANIIKDEKV